MADLVQEGLQYLLENGFSEVQNAPANFYVGLAADSSIVENATLASLTEITGTNYARQPLASSAVGFPTSASAGTNDWHIQSAAVTFTGDAADDWDTANSVFLATSADGSGKLIAWCALGAARTLLSGDTLEVTVDITLAG